MCVIMYFYVSIKYNADSRYLFTFTMATISFIKHNLFDLIVQPTNKQTKALS